MKGNNIVIEKLAHSCRPVLIDFGKACFIKDAHTYHLTKQQMKRYEKLYPHVAPEVRQGVATQSCESDIYSFGRIPYEINTLKLNLPMLHRMADKCMSSSYKIRPKAKELKVFVFNLK